MYTPLHSYFMTVWILDKDVKLEDGETLYTLGVEGGRTLSSLLVTDRWLNWVWTTGLECKRAKWIRLVWVLRWSRHPNGFKKEDPNPGQEITPVWLFPSRTEMMVFFYWSRVFVVNRETLLPSERFLWTVRNYNAKNSLRTHCFFWNPLSVGFCHTRDTVTAKGREREESMRSGLETGSAEESRELRSSQTVVHLQTDSPHDGKTVVLPTPCSCCVSVLLTFKKSLEFMSVWSILGCETSSKRGFCFLVDFLFMVFVKDVRFTRRATWCRWWWPRRRFSALVTTDAGCHGQSWHIAPVSGTIPVSVIPLEEYLKIFLCVLEIDIFPSRQWCIDSEYKRIQRSMTVWHIITPSHQHRRRTSGSCVTDLSHLSQTHWRCARPSVLTQE